jgi:hypothetical protein
MTIELLRMNQVSWMGAEGDAAQTGLVATVLVVPGNTLERRALKTTRRVPALATTKPCPSLQGYFRTISGR